MDSMQNKGFVLLITLCSLSVMTLLLLTAMQHLFILQRANNQLQRQHHQFYELELLARNLVAQKSTSNCSVVADNPNQIIKSLKQHQGCSLEKENLEYWYSLEELGNFPCAVVYQNNKKWSTKHRRLSIVVQGKNQQIAVLQIRYVLPIQEQVCDLVEKRVNLGVSSWRYFTL